MLIYMGLSAVYYTFTWAFDAAKNSMLPCSIPASFFSDPVLSNVVLWTLSKVLKPIPVTTMHAAGRGRR